MVNIFNRTKNIKSSTYNGTASLKNSSYNVNDYLRVFNPIRQKLPSLEAIEHKSFISLKIILSFILIVSILFSWLLLGYWMLDREDGITIQPFETSGINENLDGKSLADLLRYDLQRIKEINEQPIQDLSNNQIKDSYSRNQIKDSYSRLIIPSTALEETELYYSLSEVGTVSAWGASVPLGNMLLAIKALCGNKLSAITCRIQRYNSTIIITATLDDHQSLKKSPMTWEVVEIMDNNTSCINEQVPLLIDDLAFQISHEMSRRWARSNKNCSLGWQSFKHLTKGRAAYLNYVITKNKTDLYKAKGEAVLARYLEPNYEGPIELLSDLGFVYIGNKNFSEAADIFKSLSDIKPFESAFGLGISYGYQRQYKNALIAFNRATILNPKSCAAWYNKGLILLKQHDNKSIQAFNMALEINSSWPLPWTYKGDAFAQEGKYDKAIQAYDAALKLNPQLVKAWNNKGSALIRQGKYYEAVICFDKAIEINPQMIETWKNKGSALSFLSKYDEAIQAYDSALQIDPQDAIAWSNKGLILYYQNNYEKALQAFERSSKIDPGYSLNWDRQGLVLDKLERFADAVDVFIRANKLEDKNRKMTAMSKNDEEDNYALSDA